MALVATQAFVATMVGAALGHLIGAAVAERAELLSGLVLTMLAGILLATQLLPV